MQEELEQKSVAISIKAGKLTANLLKKALEKALAEMTKSQKNPKIYKGKQSVKHLVRQGAGVSNIEITDGNIKSFERVARKYGVDFALKKDTTSQPPRYLVFFKSRDADALTAAFAEYSGKVIKRQSQEKPSVRRQLTQLQEVVRKNRYTYRQQTAGGDAMKNLPKINPAKAFKASLPYLIAGLLCTKLGEAYRLTTGGDVIDRLLAAFTKLGLVFQTRFPAFIPLTCWWAQRRLCCCVWWSGRRSRMRKSIGTEKNTARPDGVHNLKCKGTLHGRTGGYAHE